MMQDKDFLAILCVPSLVPVDPQIVIACKVCFRCLLIIYFRVHLIFNSFVSLFLLLSSLTLFAFLLWRGLHWILCKVILYYWRQEKGIIVFVKIALGLPREVGLLVAIFWLCKIFSRHLLDGTSVSVWIWCIRANTKICELNQPVRPRLRQLVAGR